MQVIIETEFVNGDRSVNTGSCADADANYEATAREEAKRIADALGCTFSNILNVPPRKIEWERNGQKVVSTHDILLRLDIINDDGKTVARVEAYTSTVAPV